MRLQRDSYAPKSCAFDAANVQFLRAHLCKSHPVLQHYWLNSRISLGLDASNSRKIPPARKKMTFFRIFSFSRKNRSGLTRQQNPPENSKPLILFIIF